MEIFLPFVYLICYGYKCFFENLNAIWEIQTQSQFKQLFYTFSIPTKITAQENAEILL